MVHPELAASTVPPADVMPALALIAAVARNGVIGRDNRMPWHLPEDLRHFRRVTMGAPVIMGRKTFESIGRALPGRRNIVLTRDPSRCADDAIERAASLQEALAMVSDAPRIFVIGGGEIYAQALPRAARVHLTEIDATFEGDACFPQLDSSQWSEIGRDPRRQDDPPLAYAFVTYERIAIRS